MEEKTNLPKEETSSKPVKGYYSLDELNEQFLKGIKPSQNKNIDQKKSPMRNATLLSLLIIVIAFILILTIILWPRKETAVPAVSVPEQTALESAANETGLSNGTDSVNETGAGDREIDNGNQSVLSDEEQQKWFSQEIDLEGKEVYIELNSRIYLEDNKAYIRLINPIYSIYYYKISIYPREAEDTILYQSEMLAPGTILEAVVLQKELSESEYEAVVEYKIYDSEGNELGRHPVNVEFTTDQQYK